MGLSLLPTARGAGGGVLAASPRQPVDAVAGAGAQDQPRGHPARVLCATHATAAAELQGAGMPGPTPRSFS